MSRLDLETVGEDGIDKYRGGKCFFRKNARNDQSILLGKMECRPLLAPVSKPQHRLSQTDRATPCVTVSVL